MDTPRIDRLSLVFHDERNHGSVADYSGPGWYITITDAAVENQSYIVRPRKITPAQAEALAQSFAEVLGEPAVLAGVRAQHAEILDRLRRERRRLDNLMDLQRQTVSNMELFAAQFDTTSSEGQS